MIKRTQVGSGVAGVAWTSRGGWFWLSFNGDIFSFMVSLGRFSVTFEKKHKWPEEK